MIKKLIVGVVLALATSAAVAQTYSPPPSGHYDDSIGRRVPSGK